MARTELTRFLRHARARVRPDEFGLPIPPGRRQPGLSRGDVSLLLEISEEWYKRFEAGRARLSAELIYRLCDLLRLNRGEREMVQRWCWPGVAIASPSLPAGDGVNAAWRTTLGRMHAAGSSGDVGAAIAPLVLTFAPRGSMFYWQRMTDEGHLFESVAGPRSDGLHGYTQPHGTVDHIITHLRDGQFVAESDLERSPSAEMRARVVQYGARSYVASPVLVAGRLAYNFGFASPLCYEPSALDAHVLTSLAVTCEHLLSC